MAVVNEIDEDQNYSIDLRKLYTIYQFAQAMPWLFVPAAHIKECDTNKHERGKLHVRIVMM